MVANARPVNTFSLEGTVVWTQMFKHLAGRKIHLISPRYSHLNAKTGFCRQFHHIHSGAKKLQILHRKYHRSSIVKEDSFGFYFVVVVQHKTLLFYYHRSFFGFPYSQPLRNECHDIFGSSKLNEKTSR